jgi:uncharacterized protein YciI
MLYAIISQDVENSLEKRKGARPDHIARLNQLQDQGRLILAGPHPSIDVSDPGEAGFSGSLIVAKFDDCNRLESGPMLTLMSMQVFIQVLS